MTTVTVTQTRDYTNDQLGLVDRITFTNAGFVPATATFADAQLEEVGQTSHAIVIAGSTGLNRILVNVNGLFSAAEWTFANWTLSDRITLQGGAGNDQIMGSSRIDLMRGGDGNDFLWSGGSADRLFGDDGDDSFLLGGGEGSTIGTPAGGSDAGMAGTTVDGGAGIDLFRADFSSSATVFNIDISAGGAGADIGGGIRAENVEKLFVFLGAGNDRVVGGALNDYVYTSGGSNDTVEGGDGNDHLEYDLAGGSLPNAMVLDGGEGTNDRLTLDLRGSTGDVLIDQTQTGLLAIGSGISIAGFETLSLKLGAGNDTVIGGAGQELVNGGQGDDLLLGGDGRDAFYVDADGGVDTIDGGAGVNSLFLDRSATTQNLLIDLSDGGGGRDIGDGTVFSGITTGSFTTGSGNDTVMGLSSNNNVELGAGNDVLGTTIHMDGSVEGGEGVDSLVVTLAGEDVTVDLYFGYFTTNGGLSETMFEGFESATTGAGNDALIGSATANRLNGMGGNDALTGAAGADMLSGGDGADSLTGGRGADLLVGGGGADRFVLTLTSDSTARLGIDTIKGFEQGLDRIDLSAIDAVARGFANEAFVLITGTVFSRQAGELLVKVRANTTTVQGDTDGDAVADFTLVLGGAHTLGAGDFVL